jgi:hypothetical protein
MFDSSSEIGKRQTCSSQGLELMTRFGIPLRRYWSVLSPHPFAAVRPPRISIMMEGNLVHRVEPTYPAIAKQAGVEGTVVIKAIISQTGAIEQEQMLSRHPLLALAALGRTCWMVKRLRSRLRPRSGSC